jgi:hypothetical protein
VRMLRECADCSDAAWPSGQPCTSMVVGSCTLCKTRIAAHRDEWVAEAHPSMSPLLQAIVP